MSEMVERVARALARSDEQNGAGSWDYWESQGRDGKRVLGLLRENARAAIEAMREPTEAMIIAGGDITGDGDALDCASVYRDMIDGALR